MVLVQDASFKKPKGNWKKKYVQLDFMTSTSESDYQLKEMKIVKGRFEDLGMTNRQEWCLRAFM